VRLLVGMTAKSAGGPPAGLEVRGAYGEGSRGPQSGGGAE
jgi:hypothetical protein